MTISAAQLTKQATEDLTDFARYYFPKTKRFLNIKRQKVKLETNSAVVTQLMEDGRKLIYSITVEPAKKK